MTLYPAVMDSDWWIDVLLSVLGEKIVVLYFGSKIFRARTQLWANKRERGYSIFFFYQLIESKKQVCAFV